MKRFPALLLLFRTVTHLLSAQPISHQLKGLIFNLRGTHHFPHQWSSDMKANGTGRTPEAPISRQRCVMETIKQESGTILPALGTTFEY